MVSAPGAGPSPAEFSAPTGEPVFEAPVAHPMLRRGTEAPVAAASDIRGFNMGRGEKPTNPESASAMPTHAELDLSKVMLGGTETHVVPVAEAAQPQVLTETERAQIRLTEKGVYLPNGSIHPDVIAALTAEGHDAEEVARMSPTTLNYVIQQAVDEGLWSRNFVAPQTEVASREPVAVNAENMDAFMDHILSGGTYTADGEARTIEKSDAGMYYFVKPDGTRGANLGSENRMRQFFGTKVSEAPGRFTF